jgi:capsular polysaccharide biosynthesis protein
VLDLPGGKVRSRLSEVRCFEELADVELIDIALPREDGFGGHTRTVQASPHPELLSEGVAQTHLPRVAVVPDGRLATSGGAVISRDGQLVLETLWDEEHRRRQFDPPPPLPTARRLPGRHASVVSLWCHNFFHWVFEALPRLAVLQASGVSYDSLIVPDPLSRFQYETLEVLGIPRDLLTPFVGQHLQAEELIWPAPPAPIGHPTRYSIGWLKRSLGPPTHAAVRPSARIYLQRTGSRRVTNERSLLRMLNALEFEVVDPGALTFRDQAQLFASTAVALGPHGAAFANGIFSDSLSVLEFYQPAHVNVSIVNVMAAAGHAHWSLTCKRVPSLRRASHRNMFVPVDLVERTLELMGVLA